VVSFPTTRARLPSSSRSGAPRGTRPTRQPKKRSASKLSELACRALRICARPVPLEPVPLFSNRCRRTALGTGQHGVLREHGRRAVPEDPRGVQHVSRNPVVPSRAPSHSLYTSIYPSLYFSLRLPLSPTPPLSCHLNAEHPTPPSVAQVPAPPSLKCRLSQPRPRRAPTNRTTARRKLRRTRRTRRHPPTHPFSKSVQFPPNSSRENATINQKPTNFPGPDTSSCSSSTASRHSRGCGVVAQLPAVTAEAVVWSRPLNHSSHPPL